MENRFTRNKNKFDPIGSTYKHIIYTNVSKCNILEGYSKGMELPEVKDKEVLLQKVILRLLNRGYLKNSTKIEFFKKNFLDNKKDVLILVLTNTGYQFSNEFSWIEPFLEKVYHSLKNSEQLAKDLIIERSKFFFKYGLDIELYKEICIDRIEFINKMKELKELNELPYNILIKFYDTYYESFCEQTILK